MYVCIITIMKENIAHTGFEPTLAEVGHVYLMVEERLLHTQRDIVVFHKLLVPLRTWLPSLNKTKEGTNNE